MKHFLLSLASCLALVLTVGCGGSGETKTVDTTVTTEDQQAADETMEDYNSDEYAAEMAKQQQGN